MQKGFTLIELLVTMTIIGILSSVLFLANSAEEKRLALGRSIFQLSQDIREVQGLAMGFQEESCPGGAATGFGIQFKASWQDHYILFADCDGNHKRTGADKDIRTVYLEKSVEISDLKPASSFGVVFEPPEPKTYINQQEWGQEAVITLEFDSAKSRKVKINSVGRIEIE